KTDSLPPESAIRPAIGIEVALPSGYAGDSTRALDVKRMLNAVYPNASSVSGRNGWLNQRKRKNDRHNFALVEAVQSIICTDPDVSFMVFQKCGDRVVRKPVGRREAFHSRVLFLKFSGVHLFRKRHTAHSVTDAADPQ